MRVGVGVGVGVAVTVGNGDVDGELVGDIVGSGDDEIDGTGNPRES